MSRVKSLVLGIAAMLITSFLPMGNAQQAARPGADIYRQLHWRFIGPEGNRF